jgi:hypothetical protein
MFSDSRGLETIVATSAARGFPEAAFDFQLSSRLKDYRCPRREIGAGRAPSDDQPLRLCTASSGTSAAVPVSATTEKKEDEQYDDYGSHVESLLIRKSRFTV